ncbi:MAG: arginine repressor [Lachnospiraceae bacterium]|nr:arginine repressor [Lachnospiraceae bacterium]
MKDKRKNMIIELIKNNEIETQEELMEMLKNSGFTVTQATVSRDIRELGITKAPLDKNTSKYVFIEGDKGFDKSRYVRILKTGFLTMEAAENILVIKTLSGMAMAVAAAIDNLEIDGVVGSIAGDDTIMCAIKTVKEVPVVMKSIEKMIS